MVGVFVEVEGYLNQSLGTVAARVTVEEDEEGDDDSGDDDSGDDDSEDDDSEDDDSEDDDSV